jgi:hypothetical protein
MRASARAISLGRFARLMDDYMYLNGDDVGVDGDEIYKKSGVSGS